MVRIKTDKEKRDEEAQARAAKTLTPEQKDIQRKREISKSVTQEQKDKGTTRRRAITELEQEGIQKQQMIRPEEQLAQVGDLRKQELIEEQKQKELLPVAEESGVFEDRPERVELSPTQEEKERKSENKRFTEAQKEQLKAITGGEYEKYAQDLGISTQVLDDLIQNPETQRQIMLQEIQREELDKSLTANQKVGAALEPYLGDLKVFDIDIGGYVDKFARMPKKEVETIVESIGEMESAISGMTDSASQGEIGNPAVVLRDIAQREQELAIYEARIKRLIIESPELRANPENVNLIEEKILSARETMFEAKQRAAEGALITPSNEQLFLKLQEIRQ